jgi:hypothetical protein
MNWQDDTSVWHQTGSYGRTRRFLIPMNPKNNIVIVVRYRIGNLCDFRVYLILLACDLRY